MDEVVIQPESCVFCKLSHNKGKNHVYSKRHKAVIERILSKFKLKLKESLVSSKSPEVYNEYYEKDAKFWCYFCSKDLPKHIISNGMTIKNQSMLKHFTDASHKHFAHIFWWNHRLPKETMKNYLIDVKVYDRFLQKINDKKDEYQERMEKDRRKTISNIKTSEDDRKKISQFIIPEKNSIAIEEPIPKRTIYKISNSEGVTYIGKNNMSSVGNIRSGATPPWLMKSNDDGVKNAAIGPTNEDFLKHLNREKKKKLNPNRVGANFNHEASTSSDWLPSFGRVWTAGRRKQSKHDFKKEFENKRRRLSNPRSEAISNKSEFEKMHLSKESNSKLSQSYNPLPKVECLTDVHPNPTAINRRPINNVAHDALAIASWSQNNFSHLN